ncbi:hypothetical protein [Cohnella sp. JJ-181]|uniref:hypothetical protein n=1 Tax=Cohnella rhizoplanae TaxID=2974897 RepID=UPI0022FF6902|nr:hypothetical protein [Cohnella sp. JJ-181]CAI6086700.1 hypothetical protein COHCIP112018_05134 [Cohnella sp. JJ-181]
MPIYTPLLNLLKKVAGIDPPTDKFNIQTMMNDNWDKIDAAMAMQAVDGNVRVATTANISLTGLQTVDGVVLVAGDRVLVKNQTTGSQNGIYLAASGAWTRSADADTTAKMAAGISVYVRAGTVNAGKTFAMSNASVVMLGTTAITFAEITAGYLDQSVKTTSSPTFAGGTFTGTVTAARIVSTQSSGTAPFTVTSTTKVTNLNADLLDDMNASGSVAANTIAARDGSGDLSAATFKSTTTGAAPLIVTSNIVVPNLNTDLLDGRHASGFYQYEPTVITDANALTVSGVYIVGSEFTGSPFTGLTGANQGYLEHFAWGSNANYSMQRHTPINASIAQRYRIKDNGTWGAWRTVLDDSATSFMFTKTNGPVYIGTGTSGSIVFNVNGDVNDITKSPLFMSPNYSVTMKNVTIDRGATNSPALQLTSSSGGWGSGMYFVNTNPTGKTYGIYSGSDGQFHIGLTNSDVLTMNSDLTAAFASTLTAKRLDAVNTSATLSVLSRTDSATNASTEYRTTAGSVYAGNADGTNFGISSDANLSVAKFKVDKTTGKVQAPQYTDGNAFSKNVGSFNTAASTANQKIDLYWTGGFVGYLDVTVLGGWNNANNTGAITKRFGIVLSGAGTISAQETRYTEAIGAIKNRVAITDVVWDATNSRWKIQISVQATSNGVETFRVLISGAAQDNTPGPTNLLAAALGTVYTTDTSVLALPRVTSPDLVGRMSNGEFPIGTTNTTILTRPTNGGNYMVGVYLRVLIAATNVTVQVWHRDSGGSQTLTIVNNQNMAVGSYSLPLTMVNTNGGADNLSVVVSASTANRVFASSSILEV